jgi:hypothetical protein
MGHDEIDHLLASLGRPSSLERRLEILDHLITYWHGGLDAGPRRTEAELRGFRLSRPLRWLYERGVDRSGVFSRQNQLLGPGELEIEDGHLLFYVEAQGVYLWATAEEKGAEPLGQLRLPFLDEEPPGPTAGKDDDPPVWGRFSKKDKPWVREEVRLSEFLIQVCLFEAIMSAPHGAWASWDNQHRLDRVTAPLQLVPLGPWRWPKYPHRFWAGGGAFVFACPNGLVDGELGYTIHAGAKAEEPLHYLKAIVDRSWEYRTF